MERLEDSSRPVRLVGPEEQRYGAWARRIPAQQCMRFRVHRDFLAAQTKKRLLVRVVYLDDGAGSLETSTASWRRSVQLADTGRWKIAQWRIEANELAPDDAGDLVITAVDEPVTLHMVEVARVD
jgi:hypothetical protein